MTKTAKSEPEALLESIGENDTAHQKIAKLLKNLETKVNKEGFKATLGDFIRLVQLERELADEDEPREIRVTWVEPRKTSDSAK